MTPVPRAGQIPPGTPGCPLQAGEISATTPVLDSDADGDIAGLARGGLLNLIGAACFGLGMFAMAVLITRGIGPRRAGAFFEVLALFIILSTVTQLGGSVGIVRALARARALERPGDLRSTVTVALVPALVAGSAAGAAMYLWAPSLASFLTGVAEHRAVVTYLHLFAPALPLSAALMVLLPATQGLGTMVPTNALENIFQPLLRAVLASALVLGVAAPGYLPFIWTAPVAIAFCWALVWLRALVVRTETGSTTQVGRRPLREVAGEFWRFTSLRSLGGTFQIALAWLDVLLVGALSTSTAASIYTAASRYMIAGTMVITAIIVVVQPQATILLAHGALGRLRAVYQTATVWLIGLAFPVYLTMASFAPVWMRIFGPRFVAGGRVLMTLSLAMLVNIASGPVMALVLMGGRSFWNVVDTLGALVVNVGLNLLLIPTMGMEGAAIAAATSIVIINIVPLVQVLSWWRVHPFGRGFPVVVTGSLVCFGVIPLGFRLIAGASPAALAAAVALALPIYVGVLWHWREEVSLSAFAGAIKLSWWRQAPGVV